jgi:hypothetical protein
MEEAKHLPNKRMCNWLMGYAVIAPNAHVQLVNGLRCHSAKQNF